MLFQTGSGAIIVMNSVPLVIKGSVLIVLIPLSVSECPEC